RSTAIQTPGAWSRDGVRLAFVQETSSGSEIWVLTRQSGRVTFQPWRPNTRYHEGFPDWSPDGQWIAYTSDESGRDEVYLQPYPGPGSRIPVSRDGGTRPIWSHDGREIFFRCVAERYGLWGGRTVHVDGGSSVAGPECNGRYAPKVI